MSGRSVIWTSDRSLRVTFADEAPGGDPIARALAATDTIRRSESVWLIDAIPGEDSVGLIVDPLAPGAARAAAQIEEILRRSSGAQDAIAERAEHELPVCYGGRFGEDLEWVASQLGISQDTVIEMHAEARYRVVSVGFSPGFAYLGGLPEALRLPRRDEPRTRVPPGSVAIAEDRTAVYPHATPGGWHLIGQCGVTLFDRSIDPPALLRMGDQVRFRPVSQAVSERGS